MSNNLFGNIWLYIFWENQNIGSPEQKQPPHETQAKEAQIGMLLKMLRMDVVACCAIEVITRYMVCTIEVKVKNKLWWAKLSCLKCTPQ